MTIAVCNAYNKSPSNVLQHSKGITIKMRIAYNVKKKKRITIAKNELIFSSLNVNDVRYS